VPDDSNTSPEERPARKSERWRERAERAERERDRAQREHDRVQRENDRLRQQIDQLKRQLDEARRAGFRQAAPFAKPLTPHPKRPGRKAGPAYGRKAHRAVPPQADETYEAPVPGQCPDCGGVVKETAVATQYQEELPVVRTVVRRFHVHVGRCQACGRRVQGRHPFQTSNALGAAAAQIGPQAVASAVVLNKQLGLSFGDVATLFQQQYGLRITPSGLVHAVHRAGRQAQPTYDTLCDAVRGSPVVTPDETGWKVAGTLQWLWTVATPETTVYAIQPGRGFAEAATLLGEDFAGVMVRDGWAPYRRFTHAVHQTCLAHLLRRCRLLQTDHPRARFVHAVRTMLQHALALRDRHHAGRVTAHGLAVARGHLVNRLNRRLDHPGSVADVQRFASHLALEFPAIFTFLLDPTAIDATNWRAEQALRPAVVTRKVCGGNRSWHGAATQQILASVLRTAHQRQLDVHALMVSMLRAPRPTVPPDISGHAR
jgi:transposase